MLQQTATLLERAIQLAPTNAVYVTEVCVYLLCVLCYVYVSMSVCLCVPVWVYNYCV